MQIGERRPHADQRRPRAHHDGIAEEAVLPGDKQPVGVFPHDGGDALEGDDRVQRGDLDADHVRQAQDPVQSGVVVRHAAGGVVEIEGDDGQLGAERLVIGDRVGPPREREQRVGAAGLGFARHVH